MPRFGTGPDAPFIQRAEVPDPGRSSRRRLAFGYIRGPMAGVLAVPAVADELLDMLTEGRRQRKAGIEAVMRAGREARRIRQQQGEGRDG